MRASIHRSSVVLLCATLTGCGDAHDPETPVATSGTIAPAIAAELIAFNQQAEGSASFRELGIICRWELPVRVFVQPPVERANAEEALKYWESTAGIRYVIVGSDESPRIIFREGTDGIAVVERGFGARSGIDGTFDDNRARSGFVVVNSVAARCSVTDPLCVYIYRHELGHALGYLAHNRIPRGLMSEIGERSTTLDPLEIAMMRQLYALPHGARVEADGSWSIPGR